MHVVMITPSTETDLTHSLGDRFRT
jgi:hypothetical protein